jgi:DNA polymerase-3 subunit chi
MTVKDLSIYEITNQDIFDKTICQIIEKCYSTGQNTLVTLEDDGYKEILNKMLWTFSQKSFIPHASDADMFPEIQPILFCSELKNLNNSKILVSVGKKIDVNDSDFQKIIFIFSKNNPKHNSELANLKTSIANNEYKFFIMDEKGNWLKN